jgi:LuxR family transcriptional regulator (chaperone HchA-associated)
VYWIEGDWLGEGRETDLARYLHACPVNRHVLDSDAPFFWSKREGVRARYQVVRHPRGDGLHGLQVPVFGTTGLEGAISFAGTIIDASAPARLLLESAGTAAFRAARRLAEAPAERPVGGLSTREREVLRWVAAGRRQAEIAATLGLSARTVENHLRRARQRLGVATTAQAVRAAARRGEIED